MSKLEPGMVVEAVREVTQSESAGVLGSGTLDVLGTPAIALMIEHECLNMVDDYLPEGQTTVGVQLDISHVAPTPVGDVVHIKAEVVEVEEHFIHYRATVWDSHEKVGEATHKRAIIDIQRFLTRVNTKLAEIPSN